MAEPLEQQLVWDISPALASIGTVDEALQQAASNFGELLTNAVTGLSTAPVTFGENVDLTSLVAAITDAITQAIAQASATPLAVEADTSQAESEISQLWVPQTLEVDADTSAAAGEIDSLATPLDLPVEADTAGAADQIGELAQPLDLPVDADTTQAQAAVDDLAGTDLTVPVTADTEAAAAEVEGLGATEIVVPVDADTTSAEASIEGLASTAEVSVEADTTAAAESIGQLGGEPITLPVDGDVTPLTDAVASIAAGLGLTVTVDADTTSAAAEITALDAQPLEVHVNADTLPAEDAIQNLSGEQVDVGVNVDTGGSDAEIQAVGKSAAGASSELDLLGASATSAGIATGIATGETSGLTSAVGGLTAETGAAVAGGAALLAFLGKTITLAADAEAQQNRFNDVFGQSTKVFESIKVGGLETDLKSLGEQTGTLNADLEASASRIGLIGNAAGAQRPKVAGIASDVLALAGTFSVVNPRLGDASQIADKLTQAFVTGRTRALVPYGIALTQAQIQQEAMAQTQKKSASELTGYDKLVAGVTLALQQQGNTLGSQYADGVKNAQVQLRVLKVDLEETLTELGAPLLGPAITSLEEFLPVAEATGRVLGGVLRDTLPIVRDLGPLLTLFAGTLNLVADGLNAIPQPVVEVVSGFIALSLALRGFLILETVVASLTGFDIALGVTDAGLLSTAASAGIFGTAIDLALGPIGLAVAGLTIVASVLGVFDSGAKNAAPDITKMSTAIFGTATAADELSTALDKTDSSLAAYLATQLKTGKSAEDNQQAISELHLSYTDLAKILQSSDSGFQTFIGNLEQHAAAVGLDNGITNTFIDSLVTQRQTLQASAGAQLDQLFATKQLTQAQYDRIKAEHGINDAIAGTLESTGDYVGALTDATNLAEQNATAQDKGALATAEQGRQFRDLTIGLADGRTTVDAYALSLQNMGFEASQATDFAKAMQQEIASFVSGAVSQLPTFQTAWDDYSKTVSSDLSAVSSAMKGSKQDSHDLFQQLLTDSDPAKITANLIKQAVSIATFSSRLDKLAQTAPALADSFGKIGPATSDAVAFFLAHPDQAKIAEGATTLAAVVTNKAADALQRRHTAFETSGEDIGTAALAGVDITFRPDFLGPVSPALVAAADAIRRNGTISQAAGDRALAIVSEFHGKLTFDQTVQLALLQAERIMGGDRTIISEASLLGRHVTDRFEPDFTHPVSATLAAAATALAADPLVSQAAGQKGLEAVSSWQGTLTFDQATRVALGSAFGIISKDGRIPSAAEIKAAEAIAAYSGKLNLAPSTGHAIGSAVITLNSDGTISTAVGKLSGRAAAAFDPKLSIDVGIKGVTGQIEKDGSIQTSVLRLNPKIAASLNPDFKGQVKKSSADAAALITGLNDLPTQAGVLGGHTGQAFGDGMVTGINSKTEDVQAAASALAGAAETAARKKHESTSPSKVAIRIGRDFGSGLALGLADSTATSSSATLLAGQFTQIGHQAVAGVVAGFNDPATINAAIARLQALIAQATTSAATQAARTAAQTAFTSFVSSAVSQLPTLSTAMQTFTTGISNAESQLTSASQKVSSAHDQERQAVKTLDDAYTQLAKDRAAHADASTISSDLDRVAQAQDGVTAAHIATNQAVRGETAARSQLASASSPAQFVNDLNAQTRRGKQFQENIRQLLADGDRALATQLVALGPEAAGKITAALAAHPARAAAANAAIVQAQAFTDGFQTFLDQNFAPKVPAPKVTPIAPPTVQPPVTSSTAPIAQPRPVPVSPLAAGTTPHVVVAAGTPTGTAATPPPPTDITLDLDLDIEIDGHKFDVRKTVKAKLATVDKNHLHARAAAEVHAG